MNIPEHPNSCDCSSTTVCEVVKFAREAVKKRAEKAG